MAAELGEAPGRALVESVWAQPCSDVALGLEDGRATPEARYEQRESVELAFVAALQHLPATQRAVLILREVLGFSAQETGELLETTVASVNSALQRARRTIDERLPEQSQQETLRALGDKGLREVVENYMDAMGRGDVDAVVAMLAEDAAWSMPPMATWYHGHAALRRFLEMGPLSGAWRWRHVPARANGQPIGAYTWREDEGCYRPFALDVLTLGAGGSKLAQVTSFIARSGDELTPEELLRFPDEAVDTAKVGSIFTLCGLPDRRD